MILNQDTIPTENPPPGAFISCHETASVGQGKQEGWKTVTSNHFI